MSNEPEMMSPTMEIINKCIEDLCDEIEGYQAEKEACEILWEADEESKKYKICCFVKSEKALETYTNLDLCVGIGAQAQAKLIGDNVKNYSQEDSDLESSLKDAIKSIKEVKSILADASDKACKLDRCVEEEERCNPDILKTIKKGVSNFNDKIERVKKHPRKCYDLAVRAFDGGVDVAGIQSFTDLNSLVKIGADLITSIDAFKGDIETNIKKSSDELLKGKIDLTTILQDLEKIIYKKCSTETDLLGTDASKDFIKDPACDDCDEHDLERLCRKVKRNFHEDEGDDDDPYDKDYPGKDREKEQKRKEDEGGDESEAWGISES